MDTPDPHQTTRALRARQREILLRKFRLEVIGGPDAGRSADSSGPELSVGLDPGNDLVVADTTVSRHHCTVTATAEGFLLRDLDSTNGTRIGETRVLAAYLQPGAILRLGNTALRFDSVGDEIHEPLSDDDRFGRALGRSAAMRRVFALLPRIAAADSTVLLEGETGTGKGLLAQALHAESPRAAGPLIVVDCGAIPPTLIESELFGHEKGAFTGAQTARAGAFEAAGGGTLFLDEIGELPLDMQPKLLRVLEERTIKRVGSNHQLPIDVRVLAATNRDLRREVNAGSFRSDLFYRLNIIRVHIPPLRERKEDIPLLIEHFYRQFAGDDDPGPPAEMIATFCQHAWPGNVRELRSSIERAVLMGDLAMWQEITSSADPDAPAPSGSAPDVFDESLSYRAAKERAMARWERWYVGELTGRHGNNLSRAARAARMDRNYLRELLNKHKVGGASS